MASHPPPDDADGASGLRRPRLPEPGESPGVDQGPRRLRRRREAGVRADFDASSAVAELVDFIRRVASGGPSAGPPLPDIPLGHRFHPLYAAVRLRQGELDRLLVEQEEIRNRLRRWEADRIAKNEALAQINTTLRIVLEKRRRDRISLEGRLSERAASTVGPPLAALRRQRLDPAQQDLVSAMETAAGHVLSPLAGRLSSIDDPLRKRELLIAFLVRHGRTSRAIASMLGLSHRTVDVHRRRIRRRIGLPWKKERLHKALSRFDVPDVIPDPPGEDGGQESAGPPTDSPPAVPERPEGGARPFRPADRGPGQRTLAHPVALVDAVWELIRDLQGPVPAFREKTARLAPNHPLRPVCEALVPLLDRIERLAGESRNGWCSLDADYQRLVRQSDRLEERNRHLMGLLESRRQDGERLEARLQWNLAWVMTPLLDAFEGTRPEPRTAWTFLGVRRAVDGLLHPARTRSENLVWLLSRREVEVAARIRDGVSSRSIAGDLGISVRTVESHRARIRKKLGLRRGRENLRTFLLSMDG